MSGTWKVNAFSLATTMAIAYIGCAIFDAVFPPYGLLTALAPASAWPIYGSVTGFLLGFFSFSVAGFVFGAIHGTAWEFWRRTFA